MRAGHRYGPLESFQGAALSSLLGGGRTQEVGEPLGSLESRRFIRGVKQTWFVPCRDSLATEHSCVCCADGVPLLGPKKA